MPKDTRKTFSSSATGNEATAEGTTTVASGVNSHAEGVSNTASGTASHAEGGYGTASGTQSHVEGDQCIASGTNAHAEGLLCTASGNNSHAEGIEATASRLAQWAKSAGKFAALGDTGAGNMVGGKITTNATPAVLSGGNSGIAVSGTATNVLTVLASRSFALSIQVVARRTDVAGESAVFFWRGLVARDASGSARIVGVPTTETQADAAASLWSLVVTIDTTDATNNYVKLTATGEAAKTIRWAARLDWVEA